MPPQDQRTNRVLIAFAAPREGDAVLAGLSEKQASSISLWEPVEVVPGIAVVRTGVGPAAAGGGAARVLGSAPYAAVISLGVGGALPGEAAPRVGSVVLATRSMFADLGLQTPQGFETIGEMGFSVTGSGDVFAPDARLATSLCGLADSQKPIATVSTCSGTDGAALAVRGRLGADESGGVEAMEGAAVGLVASVLGVPFAEIRVISNTCGDRSAQHWELNGALERLGRVAAELATIIPDLL